MSGGSRCSAPTRPVLRYFLMDVAICARSPVTMAGPWPNRFATDPLAQEVAEHMIRERFDAALLPIERLFVYLPFLHSEHLVHQRQSVALFQQLAQGCDYFKDDASRAITRKETIERFGRYPPRNAILGRTSTPEEEEFLEQLGSS